MKQIICVLGMNALELSELSISVNFTSILRMSSCAVVDYGFLGNACSNLPEAVNLFCHPRWSRSLWEEILRVSESLRSSLSVLRSPTLAFPRMRLFLRSLLQSDHCDGALWSEWSMVIDNWGLLTIEGRFLQERILRRRV